MQVYTYHIENPGERVAGLNSYTDTVTITIESGFPGGKPGEFDHYMQECLAAWYEGSKVTF